MMTPRTMATCLALSVSLFVLSACSKGKPPIDDATAFNQYFADKHLTMQFSAPSALNYLVSGQAAMGQNAEANRSQSCILQKLIVSKKVTFQPQPQLAPYWIMNVGGITHYGEVINLDFGTRTFISAKDGKRWADGPSEFYAETVEYAISGSSSLDKSYNFGPFAMRVVFVNNPAVGSWQIQSATPDGSQIIGDSSEGEMTEMVKEMGLNDCDAAPVVNLINEAKAIALDAQATQVTQNSGISQVGSDAVWSSDSIGKKFALADASIVAKPGTDSLNQATSVCSKMKNLGLNWAVPTIDQLNTLTDKSRRGGGLEELADTADHRFWSNLLKRVPDSAGGINKSIRLVSREIEPEGGTHVLVVYKNGGSYTDLVWGANTNYTWQVLCVSQ